MRGLSGHPGIGRRFEGGQAACNDLSRLRVSLNLTFDLTYKTIMRSLNLATGHSDTPSTQPEHLIYVKRFSDHACGVTS